MAPFFTLRYRTGTPVLETALRRPGASCRQLSSFLQRVFGSAASKARVALVLSARSVIAGLVPDLWFLTWGWDCHFSAWGELTEPYPVENQLCFTSSLGLPHGQVRRGSTSCPEGCVEFYVIYFICFLLFYVHCFLSQL